MADLTNFDLASTSPELIDIQRRQKLAQMLMQMNQPQQGQMVSGHYVAPGIGTNIANALGMYLAGSGGKKADQDLQAYAQGQQQKREDWMSQMPKATGNVSDAGPVIPQQPAAEDYTNWALRGMSIDPKAAQLGMQSANLAMTREAQAQARQDSANLRREQMEQARQNAEAQRALQLQIAQMRQQSPEKPFYNPVQTAQGIYAFNSRTGKMELVSGADGKPVIGSQSDPALQATIAGAKSAATTTGKATAESQMELPKVLAQGDEAIRLVDELVNHPGFAQAVGASRLAGFQKIPGTAAYDFETRLKQLQGKQFLQAFETLKGGGQITEVEGAKATQAIARMDAAQSEAEFKKAAKEFQDIVRAGMERAKGKAQAAPVAAQESNLDALINKYAK